MFSAKLQRPVPKVCNSLRIDFPGMPEVTAAAEPKGIDYIACHNQPSIAHPLHRVVRLDLENGADWRLVTTPLNGYLMRRQNGQSMEKTPRGVLSTLITA